MLWLDEPHLPEQVAGEHQVAVGEFIDLDGAERHGVVVHGADLAAGDVRRPVLVEAALPQMEGCAPAQRAEPDVPVLAQGEQGDSSAELRLVGRQFLVLEQAAREIAEVLQDTVDELPPRLLPALRFRFQ